MRRRKGEPMTVRHLLCTAVLLLLGAGTGFAEPAKVIKDASEYNAYTTALNLTDPARKAAAMEDFVKRYPASVVKIDALEQAMAAWQQAGKQAEVESDATRILALDKTNVRALAILTVLERAAATQGKGEALATLRLHAGEGARALPKFAKPEGMSGTDFAKLRDQMAAIFDGAAGFLALQAKDYGAARADYRKSVKLDGGNLQDIYQLGIAELSLDPPDATGFWHIAKAEDLARTQGNSAGAHSIDAYGKAKYKRYHGSEEGWEAIVAQTAKQAEPPAGFVHGIAAPGAAVAVKAVAENDPATLSIGDWEYVLSWRDASPANKAAADKVWKALQAKEKSAKLKLAVKVVAVGKDGFLAALTDENQQTNRADLRVSLAKPTPGLPPVGSAVSVIGVLDEYQPSPFQFHMKDGEIAK